MKIVFWSYYGDPFVLAETSPTTVMDNMETELKRLQKDFGFHVSDDLGGNLYDISWYYDGRRRYLGTVGISEEV